MNEEIFEILKKEDKYLVDRKSISDHEDRLHLKEVSFTCPLCGRDLVNRKQRKTNKLYEIAHIYPNRPTKEQYTILKGVERLGNNCEDFENKIALCLDCHRTQDYHTSRDDYEKLLSIKKNCITINKLLEATLTINLEKEIAYVVEKIVCISEDITSSLNILPVSIKKKFYPNEMLLKNKVTSLITDYYPYVLDLFKNLDGKNDFSFEALCLSMKSCYVKMKNITDNKEIIFNEIVAKVQKQTNSQSQIACEIVVSFFIQNCEVFDEIS